MFLGWLNHQAILSLDHQQKPYISTTDGFPSDCFHCLHWLEPAEMTDWTCKNRICPSNNHTKHTDIYFQQLTIMGIFTTEMGEWTDLNNTSRQRKIIGCSHRNEPWRKSIALLDSFMHPILGWIALCHKQVIIDIHWWLCQSGTQMSRNHLKPTIWWM